MLVKTSQLLDCFLGQIVVMMIMILIMMMTILIIHHDIDMIDNLNKSKVINHDDDPHEHDWC